MEDRRLEKNIFFKGYVISPIKLQVSNIFITNDFQQNDDESIAFANLCNF